MRQQLRLYYISGKNFFSENARDTVGKATMLGLNDVLYDVKRRTVYTPNTNQWATPAVPEARYAPDQSRDENGRFADEGKGAAKAAEPQKTAGGGLTKGGNGSIITDGKSNRNISKMKSVQLQKSIRTWRKRIAEHQDKISGLKKNPGDLPEFLQAKRIRHWKKEITNISADMARAETELKNREGNKND